MLMNLRRLAPLFLAALVLQFAAVPSSAHGTDPAHGLWTAGFMEHETVVGPGEEISLTLYSWVTPQEPLPSFEHYTREYGFTFPAGSEITHAYSGTAPCTINALSVHCEAVGLELVQGVADAVSIVFIPPPSAGTHQVNMTTTALIMGGTYSDNDSYDATVQPRGTADLAVAAAGNPEQILAGADSTFGYSVANNGPDPARQALTYLSYGNGSGIGRVRVSSVTPSEECSVSGEDAVVCRWGVLPSGATRTISVVLTQAPTPMVEQDSFATQMEAVSFENDPDAANGFFDITTATRCASYVDDASTVDPTADLAQSACTYVGQGTVAAQAKLGAGALVSMADVGAHATMEPGSTIGGWSSRRGTLGAKSSLGTASRVVGEVGESAKVGDRVDAGSVLWFVVGARASVGSGTSFDLVRGYEQTVLIKADAKVPANTVITEQYCRSRPVICEVTG